MYENRYYEIRYMNHSHCLRVITYNSYMYIQYGNTPLHDAAKEGKLELCESLIRSGLDPNATNEVSV